jgi:hypothetical protein
MPPFSVEYRCLYREWWYPTDDWNDDLSSAMGLAVAVARQHHTRTRVVDCLDNILYQYP